MGEFEFFLSTASVLVLLGIGAQLWFSAGLFVIATSLFMAVGAMVSSYASVERGWPLPLAIALALAAGGLVAAVLAPLLVRLSGIYLALASLAASELVRLVGLNLEWLTGGADGRIVPQALEWQHLVLAALLGLVGAWALQRDARGERLELLRHDRRVAASVGLDVRRSEMSYFVLGALVTTLGGALFAHVVRFVSPQEFGLNYSIEAIAVVVIGGRRSWLGPLVAVAVVAGLPHFLDLSATWSTVLSGGLLISILLLAPDGMVEFVTRRSGRMRTRRAGSPGTTPEVLRTALPAPRHDAPDGMGETAIRVDGVSFAYDGVHALDGVTFEVRAGEVVGIIGPNGAGKTTLINVCTGVSRVTSGTIHVNGSEPRRPRDFALLGVRRTFQHVQLADRLSLRGNVRLGGILAGRGEDSDAAANAALAAAGLGDQATSRPGGLPLGHRRLAELARLAAAAPRIAFLDEPSSGCDEASIARMEAAIRELADRSCAVLVVSHDLRFVAEVADKVLLMAQGRLVKELAPDALAADRTVRELYLGETADA